MKDNIPALQTDECLNQLSSRKDFSKLNLQNGFYHVSLTVNNIHY